MLNRDKIKKDPQRVSKIKPFIDQYNCNDIDFSSTGKDWKKFELNNESITFNILHVPHKTGIEQKINLKNIKRYAKIMITAT